MSGFEQKAVSQACWRWLDGAAPAGAKPDSTGLRAAVQFAVAAAVSLSLWFFLDSRVAAPAVAGFALFLLVTGLWIQPVFRMVDRFFRRFGIWVGAALTWILLVPFFHLFFIPARLLLAVRGIDPMRRRFPGAERTFWTPHKPRRGPEDYRKQF